MGGATNTAVPRDAVLLVRDFVNTIEWQEDHDSWTNPGDLERWFAERADVVVRAQTEGDLLLARRLREGLRSILLRHAGHEPLPDADAHLNQTLSLIPLRLRVDADGQLGLGVASVRHPLEPLGFILGGVDAARVEGTWQRLKVCARDSCRWAYWDATRNGSGRWCSMAGCGNYVKMRTRNGNPLENDELASAPGEHRPARLIDVAARAGVSIKTVSNVVTGAANVTPATRARVDAAVRELDYRPNLTARALRQRR
jgi:predicted RNA-binding Zn ribbon-like protein